MLALDGSFATLFLQGLQTHLGMKCLVDLSEELIMRSLQAVASLSA